MIIKKIIKNLPTYPHYKMNIFSGTNSFFEIKEVFKRLVKKKALEDLQSINDYNSMFSKSINSNNTHLFASGRMGLYTILKSINIQKDDEIIIPSFTCIVVPNAIIYSGAKPVYCDINIFDFNIDILKIESLITDKTKVIYAQHTFGQMCDIYAIKELAKKYNLVVIEDAALALGAKIKDKFAGTIGDFGYFSTDRSKVINTGLGGMVSVNNTNFKNDFEKIYENIPFVNKKYSNKIALTFILNVITLNPYIYWIGGFLNLVFEKLGLMTYFSDELQLNKNDIKKYPYPAKLSSILSIIGINQIKNLDNNLLNRRNIAKYYNDILNIYSDEYMDSENNIFLRFSFLIKNRDYWEKKFSAKIDASIWFKTVTSGRNYNFEDVFYKVGSNKISEFVCQHIFNLPTHNQIKPEKLKKLLIELKNSGDIITKE